MSAVLVTWLESHRLGHIGPDQLADAVRGDAPRHLVSGLPDQPTLELIELPARLRGAASLALPAPGDPVGLGGPAELTRDAIESGEAVLVGDVALIPEIDARTVVWRAQRADPAPWVDERETAVGLRTTLAEVTARLVDLDVAGWQPEIPDLLLNWRHRPPLRLPPGYADRRVETIERAVLCLEIVDLARSVEGGSVSSSEIVMRQAALTDLDRAARHALVGACSVLG